MIAGGGNIGRRLAAALERNYEVKLIDHNNATCTLLAEQLHRALVLQGDATDEALLSRKNIGSMDVFCALTNDDEDNIMSALLAKRMGAQRVIALINRSAYVNLVQGARSTSPFRRRRPRSAHCCRRSDAATWRRCIRCGAARPKCSRLSSTATSKLEGGGTPHRRCGPARRGGDCRHHPRREVLIAHHDTLIETEDHLIVFALNSASSQGGKAVPGRLRFFECRPEPSDARPPWMSAALPHHVAIRLCSGVSEGMRW